MKIAVQFGAGNIGRGFIGLLLENSGYNVIFADVNDKIIEKINADGEYNVKIVDVLCEEYTVKNVSAINVNDANIIEVLNKAEIITTSVGVNVLPKIANIFATFIKQKFEKSNKNKINIIACENAINASTTFKNAIYDLLDKNEIDFSNEFIGFPNCSVDRIVPPSKSDNITDVIVEKYYEWNTQKSEFKGEIPNINGMNLVNELTAYIERKLFTLNTGHAITAYLGHIKGYKTIDESILDENILSVVKGAMTESGNTLIEKYKFDRKEHFKYIDKIILRFKNPYLKDEVARVGREPLRKLGENDRLIKPLNTAISYKLEFNNLLIGIAAALHFEDKNDIQSIDMQSSIKNLGIETFINENLNINNKKIMDKIVNNYYNILKKE